MMNPTRASEVFAWPADADHPTVRSRLQPSDDGLPPEVVASADAIIGEVRSDGDAALVACTLRYDGYALDPSRIRVAPEDIAQSAAQATPELRAALARMIENVRRFHEAQLPAQPEMAGVGGGILKLLWRPVASAALYVPGGRAAYPTSVVMNAVPAQVAGVGRVAVLTVPGTIEANPAVACALELLGLDEIYRVGGAHAVAAAAYGTATIAPVDVIVGPGNAYVAAAKRRVYGRVGIDSIAGPSEVMILADQSANPRWMALDLLAQAEHDPLARCVFASTSRETIDATMAAFHAACATSPRREIVERAWCDHGLVVHAATVEDLIQLTELMAPEHLQVVLDPMPAVERFNGAAIFVGNHAPTAIGDYMAGPNHVLPTGGAARFSGPLGVMSFLRSTGVVFGAPGMMHELTSAAALLADHEELAGHAAALRARTHDQGTS